MAIRDTLKGDTSEFSCQEVPLFRILGKNSEIRYDLAVEALKIALERAVFLDLASGLIVCAW